MENLPQPLEQLVSDLTKLPTIGKRSALRLAFYILRTNAAYAQTLGQHISSLHTSIHFCKNCGHITENELCAVCSDPTRDQSTICVVEDIQDLLAMEKSTIYKGLYHVLGGHLSPIHGIMAEDLNIDSLVKRLNKATEDGTPIKEVILALNPNPDGEATSIYLAKLIAPRCERITRPGLGLAIGTNLEYADELTLRKALERRQDF